jgi:uncharacterized iron-regulated protein/predicted esterase
LAQQSRREYPPLEDSISIRDGRTGARLSWSEWIGKLRQADVVFLGESHDDDTTHQVQLKVYEALLHARKQKVILAMEMFERDVQPWLDQYLRGEIEEKAFLEKARPWGNYAEAYRPIVELAKTAGSPVVAANFPRPLTLKMMQSGSRTLDGLGSDRALAPEELLPNSPLYWKRSDNATRSHSMFMKIETDEQSRLLSTQSLWDNSMGESCVKALERHAGHQVLHLNGGFHTEYWDGTVAQVRQRKPEAKICTVAIRPSRNPLSARLIGSPSADFVVFAEERGKNLNNDVWKVVVDRENPFLFHQPLWASADKPAPLLIWLSDDGLGAKDNLTYWKRMIGDKVAVAIIEPIHRQQEANLVLGGRWFWNDTFPEDIAASQQTVEGAWRYLLNRFPIDGQKVCLAGEGTGATVVAASALLTSSMEMRAIAFRPRQYAKIKDFPLPLLEDWGKEVPPRRDLKVFVDDTNKSWWSGELAEYEKVGIGVALAALDSDPWTRRNSRRLAILQALGIPDDLPTTLQARRRVLIAQTGSAQELHWLQLLADQKTDKENLVAVIRPDEKFEPADAEPIEYSVSLDQVKAGAIPLCPGAFGGTTVLILNASQADKLDDWLTILTQDPLTARSRFHRTRIAVVDGVTLPAGKEQYRLTAVMEKLLSENRKNILIAPAVFCAGEEFMARLDRIVQPFEDRLTLHWLPGLGGEVVRVH